MCPVELESATQNFSSFLTSPWFGFNARSRLRPNAVRRKLCLSGLALCVADLTLTTSYSGTVQTYGYILLHSAVSDSSILIAIRNYVFGCECWRYRFKDNSPTFTETGVF